ncbi:pseudoazurin [Providencia rettgeri]|uniref:pseudoazurin n=1 Tax=Providencia rettgeri TaxID=587 RepID=UPI0023AAC218|nr:pseudoazurin [Providencia rettgeri]
MRQSLIAILSFFVLVASSYAEVHEVKMLNRGQSGPMVFEPDYIEIKPGDSIKFIATHKSHNAASIPELRPEGSALFKGKINEELEVPFDIPGFYGIQCTPHFSMGMVMVVKVGEANLPDNFRTYKAPGKSDKRLKDIINNNKL